MKFWNAVRRNPVVNAFVIAAATQFFQDWRAGNIDTAHILGYVSMLVISVAARQFTVPTKEHEETKALVSKAIVNLEADHQERLKEWSDRLGGEK